MSAHSTSARTSNHVPNPVRGCRFIDPGPTDSPPAELGTNRRECSLTNAAGSAFSERVYKHATPDGVGNVGG